MDSSTTSAATAVGDTSPVSADAAEGDGIATRISTNSATTAVTGSLFFVPSADFLDDPPAAVAGLGLQVEG